MTTHELLNFLRYNPKSTFDDIENYFGMSQQAVSITVVNLRKRGLLIESKEKGVRNGYRGRFSVRLELTDAGERKLEYYDTHTCPRYECACRG